jgi:hypothetical protein
MARHPRLEAAVQQLLKRGLLQAAEGATPGAAAGGGGGGGSTGGSTACSTSRWMAALPPIARRGGACLASPESAMLRAIR